MDLEQRIQRLEDRAAIQDLAVLYGFVMDERDLDGVRRIFADDATLRSADGVFAANGIEEIVKTYQGRFDVLGPTNHFTHGHVVRFGADPDTATGVLASHAEVDRNGQSMLVALRYKDTYVRTAEGWKFSDRLMSYMYYTPVTEYAEALGDKDGSVRAYGDRRPADWPEKLKADADLKWLTDLLV